MNAWVTKCTKSAKCFSRTIDPTMLVLGPMGRIQTQNRLPDPQAYFKHFVHFVHFVQIDSHSSTAIAASAIASRTALIRGAGVTSGQS